MQVFVVQVKTFALNTFQIEEKYSAGISGSSIYRCFEPALYYRRGIEDNTAFSSIAARGAVHHRDI